MKFKCTAIMWLFGNKKESFWYCLEPRDDDTGPIYETLDLKGKYEYKHNTFYMINNLKI